MPLHSSQEPRSLGVFGALWFTYFASIGLFNPYAPLWFKELGFSTLAIGAIASLQAWTRVLTPYAWGWIADHTGRRVEVMRAACVLTLAASVGLLLGTGYGWVAAVAFAVFLFNGGIVPLSEAELSRRIATADGMDTARYGRVRLWGSVGFLSAVVSFGFVLDGLSVRAFPWLVVATLLPLVAAAFRVPSLREPAHGHDVAAGALAVLREPPVRWFFASVFFTVLAHTALYMFLSLYLDNLGYDKKVVGLMWATGVVAEIALLAWPGRWFDRLTPRGWLLVAAAVAAVRFAAIAAAGQWWWVLVGASLAHAVTFAAHHVACISIVHRHFPGRLRARGQALYSVLGYGGSGVVGGVAGGALIETAGYASVFWAASVAALFGAACAWRIAAVAERA